jgi:hypothetical protein
MLRVLLSLGWGFCLEQMVWCVLKQGMEQYGARHSLHLYFLGELQIQQFIRII